MQTALTETHALVQKTARDYAQKYIAPEAARLDKEGRFPTELLKGLADLGLMAVNLPEDLGGSNAGTVAYALAMQEVAKACASTAVTMSVTNMVGEVIATFGTRAQALAYCPKLASGEFAAGSFALSEPGAGSDPGGIVTTAMREGNEYVLEGNKQWITSGAYAGVFIVWARTAPRDTHPGGRGLSCFLVEAGSPGLRIGRAEDKMGLRASNTVSLSFEGVRVPPSAMLGEPEGAFKIGMMALDGGRIGIASQAIGIARSAHEASVSYAKDRTAFGKAIAEFQALQWMMADSQTEIDAADLLCMRAACLKESDRPFSHEASMAKVYASEMAVRVSNRAVQILGGYGYTREFPVERNLRDARVTTIYEGTSEIQRIVIARALLSD